jgi:hypothetical protein
MNKNPVCPILVSLLNIVESLSAAEAAKSTSELDGSVRQIRQGAEL